MGEIFDWSSVYRVSITIDNPTATVSTDNHSLGTDQRGLYRSVLGAFMESFDGSLLGWRAATGPVLSDYGIFNATPGVDRRVNAPALQATGVGFTDAYAFGGQQFLLDHLDNCRVFRFRHPEFVSGNYSQLLSGDWTGRVWVEFIPGSTVSPQVWLGLAGGVFSTLTSSSVLRVPGQFLPHRYTEGMNVFPLGNGAVFSVFGFTHDGSWENLMTTAVPNTYAAVYKKHGNTEYIVSGVHWFVDGRGFDLRTVRDAQMTLQLWHDNVYIGKEAA